MDNTISEMFKEKNGKILIDKLLLDVSNNDDSLRLTVSNKIKLVSLKLQRRLNDCLKSTSVEYDMKSLTEVVDTLKKEVEEYIFSEIDKRKELFEARIENDPYELKDNVDLETRTDINDRLNADINNLVYVNFLENLTNQYKLTEEQKEQIVDRCLKKYDFELSAAVEDSVLDRNLSLKNTMAETIDRVNELDIKTGAKVLSKEDDVKKG